MIDDALKVTLSVVVRPPHACVCMCAYTQRQGEREKERGKSVLLYNYACAMYCCVKKKINPNSAA